MDALDQAIGGDDDRPRVRRTPDRGVVADADPESARGSTFLAGQSRSAAIKPNSPTSRTVCPSSQLLSIDGDCLRGGPFPGKGGGACLAEPAH